MLHLKVQLCQACFIVLGKGMRRFIVMVKYFLYSLKYQAVKVLEGGGAYGRLDVFLASAEDEGVWLEKEAMVPIDEKVGWIRRRSGRFEVKKILYPCRESNVGS